MKVAYLVNQYPKVSHTFIRREIAAIESLGLEVDRFSLRGTKEHLGDEADEAERRRTRALLDEGATGLAGAGLWMGVRRPRRMLRAARLAYAVGRKSDRGLLRHAVYLAEACKLASWIERSGCEHVHAHFGTNSATVAMLCHELGGPPFSFTAHGPEEFDKPDLIALRGEDRKVRLRRGRVELRPEPALSGGRVRRLGKMHVVRCGVDRSRARRPRSPVPESRVSFASVGSASKKGSSLLVEARRSCATRSRWSSCWSEMASCGARSKRAIAHHGIGDRVRITGWAYGDVVQARDPRGARTGSSVVRRGLAGRDHGSARALAAGHQYVRRWHPGAGRARPIGVAGAGRIGRGAGRSDARGARARLTISIRWLRMARAACATFTMFARRLLRSLTA